MDSSPSLVLINTDPSPASLSFPKTLGIVESYPAAQMMLVFSTASIPRYCSGKQDLASMVNTQLLSPPCSFLAGNVSVCLARERHETTSAGWAGRDLVG